MLAETSNARVNDGRTAIRVPALARAPDPARHASRARGRAPARQAPGPGRASSWPAEATERDNRASNTPAGIAVGRVDARDRVGQSQQAQSMSAATFVAGLAALDTLPTCMILTDAESRVVFVNAAARRMTGDRRSGLRITYAGAVAVLSAGHHGDASTLRSLVAQAANAGSSRAMRLHSPDVDEDRLPLVAITVTPIPARPTGGDAPTGEDHSTRGLALITARNLAAPEAPAATTLSEMFHLSAAEAAVAEALVGGATAESVAEARQVSLHTVRRQIQDVLRKTEATNLRDLERISATLASMPGPARMPCAGSAVDAKSSIAPRTAHQFW